MGKVITYVIIAFTIAFALNYFGVVDIPWLDLPQQQEQAANQEEGGKDYNKHVNQGREATRKAIDDMDKGER